MKKIFEFRGFGNFSHSFNWDDGLDIHFLQEVPWEEAKAADQNNAELAAQPGSICLYGNVLPEIADKEEICISFSNEHGSSRNVNGWVIANNLSEAKKLMKAYCDENYPVVEYQQPEDDYWYAD